MHAAVFFVALVGHPDEDARYQGARLDPSPSVVIWGIMNRAPGIVRLRLDKQEDLLAWFRWGLLQATTEEQRVTLIQTMIVGIGLEGHMTEETFRSCLPLFMYLAARGSRQCDIEVKGFQKRKK
jgi:hypothetical protein